MALETVRSRPMPETFQSTASIDRGTIIPFPQPSRVPELPSLPAFYTTEAEEQVYFENVVLLLETWSNNGTRDPEPRLGDLPFIPEEVKNESQRAYEEAVAARNEYFLSHGGPDIQAYAHSKISGSVPGESRPVLSEEPSTFLLRQDLIFAAADE